MKQTLKLKKLIDPTVKVGDIVRLIDGSALSCDTEVKNNLYIVHEYEELTGLPQALKNIPATVIEVGIDDCILPSSTISFAYLQDISVKIGNAIFRTSSQMVAHVNSEGDFIDYVDFNEP